MSAGIYAETLMRKRLRDQFPVPEKYLGEQGAGDGKKRQ